MTKDERKEQKRKEAFRKWAQQHAKLRRNLRKHGGDILQSGNFKSTNSFIQHGSVSVRSHSIRVAECSLKLEKFLEKLGIHCHERDLVRARCSTTTSSMTGMTSIPTKSCTAFTIRMLRWKMRAGSIS